MEFQGSPPSPKSILEGVGVSTYSDTHRDPYIIHLNIAL